MQSDLWLWARKNFQFCGNHDADVRAAVVCSLISSCKAIDVDPREWMEGVLLRIPGYERYRKLLGNSCLTNG